VGSSRCSALSSDGCARQDLAVGHRAGFLLRLWRLPQLPPRGTVDESRRSALAHAQHNPALAHAQHNPALAHAQHNPALAHAQHNPALAHAQHDPALHYVCFAHAMQSFRTVHVQVACTSRWICTQSTQCWTARTRPTFPEGLGGRPRHRGSIVAGWSPSGSARLEVLELRGGRRSR
jgi:hypothetical protein